MPRSEKSKASAMGVAKSAAGQERAIAARRAAAARKAAAAKKAAATIRRTPRRS